VSETTADQVGRPLGQQDPRPSLRGSGAAADFERIYRAQVDAVTAFFARRSADPQTVADLTADTFVQVIVSFGTFDPGKGSARAWVFGIARHVYAAHCEAYGRQQDRLQRLAGRLQVRLGSCEYLIKPLRSAWPGIQRHLLLRMRTRRPA